ncbi:hypothetical protein [Candidatus Nitrososphaera gargensis]|uniref:hypothetical protein n=1 Tax=Candidatus Nitrososphaera gargensis TaxID=497727 RepID=UPI0011E576E2
MMLWLIGVWIKNGLLNPDHIGNAIIEASDRLLRWSVLSVVSNFLARFGITLAVIVGDTTLLFVKHNRSSATKRNGALQNLNKEEADRPIWQLFVGYFLLILVFDPLIPNASVASLSSGTGDFFDPLAFRLYTIWLTVIVLLVSRFLSKFGGILADTNIGLFIIAIFAAEALFEVSVGEVPFVQMLAFYSNDVEWGIESSVIYYTQIISAFGATVLDWAIVKKRFQKPL